MADGLREVDEIGARGGFGERESLVDDAALERRPDGGGRTHPQDATLEAAPLEGEAEGAADQPHPDYGYGFHQMVRSTAWAMMRNCRIISANTSGRKDWAPSESAWSGS